MSALKRLLTLFLLWCTVWQVQAQSLTNLMITHNIQRSQLRNRVNSQMLFNSMLRDEVLSENGQVINVKPLTHFTKGPNRVIGELVAHSDGDQTLAQSTLENDLLAFYTLLNRNELSEQDYADGIALATVLNYLSYRKEHYINKKGLQLTAAMLRKVFLQDPEFSKKTDREKQDEMESVAIAAMTARSLQDQNDPRAEPMAAQLLESILGVAPASVTFGSGGFFTTEDLSETNQKFKKIDTRFDRSDQCLTCEQYAIDQGGTAADYRQILQGFDQQLERRGGRKDDLLDLLTACFELCYYMAKNEYRLNEKQLQSARTLILEGFSNPEDAVLHLPDEQKQINYESYAIGTMLLKQNYENGKQKQQKTRTGDYLDQAWEMARSTYDPNSLPKIVEQAEQYLRSMLFPIKLEDYILTEKGFLHRR